MLRKALASLLIIVILAAAGSLLAGAAPAPETDAANKALDYVRALQNPDGGFPSFGTESSAGATIDAVLAFAAAGIDARTVKNGSNSPLDYLEAQAAAYSATPGHAAKLVIGLLALKQDPSDFAGTDFQAKMESYFDDADDSYGDGVFDHGLYLLARGRLGLSSPSGSIDYLTSKQTGGGCWEYSDGWGCDTNTTALAIEALTAAGVPSSDDAVQDALDYLADAQNDDGGFPYLTPSDSDANSTAFVVQALVAAHEDIDEGGRWEKAGVTPMEALLTFQNPQTGAFTYAGQDDAYATYQAVPALLLRTYTVVTPTPEDEEETATPKPTKTPSPTATPTMISTATPLPPAATPIVVVQPVYVAPTSQVAGITMAATGDRAATDRGDDRALSAVILSLLAGGALLIASGAALRTRRL